MKTYIQKDISKLRQNMNRKIDRMIKIKNSDDEYLTIITKQSTVQQDFSNLIIGNELKGGGKIRNLSEVNAFRIKKLGKSAQKMTRSEYRSELLELSKRIDNRLGVVAEHRHTTSRISQVLGRVESDYGIKVPKKIGRKELSAAMRRATIRSDEAKRNNGYTNYYDYLMEELGYQLD